MQAPHEDKYFRALELPSPVKRKDSFKERFVGRTSLVGPKGDEGVAAATNRPILKLSDTNSSNFSHLHGTR